MLSFAGFAYTAALLERLATASAANASASERADAEALRAPVGSGGCCVATETDELAGASIALASDAALRDTAVRAIRRGAQALPLFVKRGESERRATGKGEDIERFLWRVGQDAERQNVERLKGGVR